jgi:hypothetical protein
MSEPNQHLDSIQDIKQLMQRSSRFISLSGLSGVAAGFCALIAAWVAHGKIASYRSHHFFEISIRGNGFSFYDGYHQLEQELVVIAAITFVLAFSLAFIFTYLRSKKTGVPIWGYVARKVMFHVTIPMVAGAFLIWRLLDMGVYGLIAPASLIFYGLGLINASKYTFPEIRYLGFGQLVLGIINLWMTGEGLTFWAIGFGILHILYGFIMWWKNERNSFIEKKEQTAEHATE